VIRSCPHLDQFKAEYTVFKVLYLRELWRHQHFNLRKTRPDEASSIVSPPCDAASSSREDRSSNGMLSRMTTEERLVVAS
jgi:hypothetical protein